MLFVFLQPPFEENGVASPIDGQKFNVDCTNLGTSIDSAMMTATNSFAKNRFLSGDHVNANNRDALLRRQLFAIGTKFNEWPFFESNFELILQKATPPYPPWKRPKNAPVFC